MLWRLKLTMAYLCRSVTRDTQFIISIYYVCAGNVANKLAVYHISIIADFQCCLAYVLFLQLEAAFPWAILPIREIIFSPLRPDMTAYGIVPKLSCHV